MAVAAAQSLACLTSSFLLKGALELLLCPFILRDLFPHLLLEVLLVEVLVSPLLNQSWRWPGCMQWHRASDSCWG